MWRLVWCAVTVAAGCKFPDLPPVDEDAVNGDGSVDARLEAFSLNTPAPVWIRLDGSQTVPISVTRESGFTDAITVALEAAPQGVTASSVEIPQGATQINLLVSATAATGAAVGAEGVLRIVATAGAVRREVDAEVLVAGAPGTLDQSFGNGGFALSESGLAMASHPYGSSYLVSGVTVSRFSRDGSLDTSFGGTGTVTPDFTSLGAVGPVSMCAAAQSDGSVVVVAGGDGDPSGSIRADTFVVRLRADGSMDPTFVGRHYFAQGGNLGVAGCKVGPTDEVIVFGRTGAFGGDSHVTRLLPDGSLDTAFGPNGRQPVDVSSGYSDAVTAVDVDADGNLIVAVISYVDASAIANGFVLKFARSGGRDMSFGGDGVVDLTAETSGAMSSAADSVIAVPGGILVGGKIATGSGTEVAIWKLQPSGAWAPGFGSGGVWRRTSTPPSSITAMTLDTDGSIFAASFREQNFQPAGLLFHHVSANGVPDSDWGVNGTVTTSTNFRVKGAHRTLRRIAFGGDSGISQNDRMGAIRIWY